MLKLDYNDFPNMEIGLQAVREALKQPGAVLISHFPVEPGDRLLVEWSLALGQPTAHKVRLAGTAEHGAIVHDIAAKPDAVPDKYGFEVISTTTHIFPLHTDDYFNENPTDAIILHCVRPDELGGLSLLAYADDIVPQLTAETVNQLSQAGFPSYAGPVAILYSEEGNPCIRYNRLSIERAAEVQERALTPDQIAALDELDRIIYQNQLQFMMAANDCLIVNNKRALHGRTALSDNSQRLLKRVRLHLSDR